MNGDEAEGRRDLERRLADVRLVVLDIDGTTRDHQDPEGLAIDRALDALDRADIPWTFATGRPLTGLRNVLGPILSRRRAVLGAVVCNDGGVLHDDVWPQGDVVRAMPAEAVAATMRALRRFGMIGAAYAMPTGAAIDDVMVPAQTGSSHWPDVDHNGIPIRRAAIDEIAASRVLSIVGIMDRNPTMEELAVVKAGIDGSVNVTSSGYRDVIVSGDGVSKGSMLARLAARYGCTARHVLAVGDGANDIAMLRAAGVGFAVANAADALKDAADGVCDAACGSGVTEIVERMLAAKARRDSGRSSSDVPVRSLSGPGGSPIGR